MNSVVTMPSIIDRHEALQRHLYRNHPYLNRDMDAKESFVQSINELLRDLRHQYTIIGDDSQRAPLYSIAQTWNSNLPTMLSRSPTEPLPLPPPSSSPLTEPLTEQELRNHTIYLAQRISEDHATYHPYMDADPNRDWHDAEIYLAKDVVVGTLRYDTALSAASYWRLENIWLSEIVQLQAYHAWEKEGRRINAIGEKSDYLAECAACTQLLVYPALKSPAKLFENTKEYILARYLQAGTHIDVNHDAVKQLIDRKISKVQHKAPSAIKSGIYDHVVTYVTQYYNNIIAAIEQNDKQAAENVLNAFHLSQGQASESSIINAFEAAIPIYFMSSDLIQELWQAPVPRIGTF